MRTEDYANAAELTDLARGWLEEIRSSVVPRPGLRLDSDRAALLVIDMNRYFADPSGRSYLPAAGAIVPRVAALVARWRLLKRPVIYTRHGHEGEHDLGMLGRFYGDHIRADEPDAEIVAALEPLPREPVIHKTTYDAFYGTRLQGLLEELDVEQLLVTGVLTHMCCETSARAAFCRGFEVYVPVDGVASTTRDRHLGSLKNLADAVAVVMSVEEVLDLCAATK